MATHNGKQPTVWMRSIRAHTYEGKAQPEGEVYLAHEDIVETIEILKFAVREPAPPTATREPEQAPGVNTPEGIKVSPELASVSPQPPIFAPTAAQPMTTATAPQLTKTRKRS